MPSFPPPSTSRPPRGPSRGAPRRRCPPAGRPVPAPAQSSTLTDRICACVATQASRAAAMAATTVPPVVVARHVVHRVELGRRAALELGVGGVDPGVQHVDRDAGSGGPGRAAAVERERGLVDAVQAPVRWAGPDVLGERSLRRTRAAPAAGPGNPARRRARPAGPATARPVRCSGGRRTLRRPP